MGGAESVGHDAYMYVDRRELADRTKGNNSKGT